MSKAIQLHNEEENIYPNPHFPVGSIYLSVLNTNPSKWFGGTWEQIAKGRTLVGVDTSDTDFNTVKKTGGEKEHILTTDEMPSHKHSIYRSGSTSSGYGALFQSSSSVSESHGAPVRETGGGKAHNNLQPYFTCYIWCRTA